jgi:hypothetical protein
VQLTLPAGATLELGERTREIGQLEGRSDRVFGWGSGGGSDYLKHVDWLVRAPQGGSVTVTATAQRAGTVRDEALLSND